MEVRIKATKRYASYLSSHLQKEHPATKGKIKIVGTKHSKLK